MCRNAMQQYWGNVMRCLKMFSARKIFSQKGIFSVWLRFLKILRKIFSSAGLRISENDMENFLLLYHIISQAQETGDISWGGVELRLISFGWGGKWFTKNAFIWSTFSVAPNTSKYGKYFLEINFCQTKHNCNQFFYYHNIWHNLIKWLTMSGGLTRSTFSPPLIVNYLSAVLSQFYIVQLFDSTTKIRLHFWPLGVVFIFLHQV